jgi:hypothetical protein
MESSNVPKPFKVKIFGLVSRLRDDGARVAVPLGIYAMEELALDQYRLSGTNLPTFDLTLLEVSTYMGTKMKVAGGPLALTGGRADTRRRIA